MPDKPQARDGEIFVKPTPTQEENDLAAMGQTVLNKEPDGSPAPEPQPEPDPEPEPKAPPAEPPKSAPPPETSNRRAKP